MTAPLTDVTKAAHVDQFQTTITSVYNAISKWRLESNPFYSNHPVGGSLSSSNYPNPAPVKSGNTLTTEPLSTSIPTADVTAAAVVTLFLNTAVTLSNVRKIRLRKYYSGGLVYDQTNDGHLTDPYRMAFPGDLSGSLAADTDISAAQLDAFVATILSRLETHRNTQLDFREYWCHSSCHSNHSSRSRR